MAMNNCDSRTRRKRLIVFVAPFVVSHIQLSCWAPCRATGSLELPTVQRLCVDWNPTINSVPCGVSDRTCSYLFHGPPMTRGRRMNASSTGSSKKLILGVAPGGPVRGDRCFFGGNSGCSWKQFKTAVHLGGPLSLGSWVQHGIRLK